MKKHSACPRLGVFVFLKQIPGKEREGGREGEREREREGGGEREKQR